MTLSGTIINSDLPLVSVVTPSLNTVRFLEQNILSVLEQDYPKIEHIIVDGGSQDGTIEILHQYTDKLIWVSEPDKGQSDALNKAMHRSHGEIICWLNADDLFVGTSAVTKAVTVLMDEPDTYLVYSDGHIIDEYGHITGRTMAPEYDFHHLLLENIIPGITPFFRVKALELAGYLDTTLHYAMDYALWLRIGKFYKCRKTEDILGSFRICAGTKTFEFSERFWVEQIRIYDRFFADPSNLPNDHNTVPRAYGRAHWKAGLAYLEKGNEIESKLYFDKALSEYHLIELDMEWAFSTLSYWIFHSKVLEREKFVLKVLRMITLAPKYGYLRRIVLARFYSDEVFHLCAYGRVDLARRYYLKALSYNPLLLMNYGYLSVGLRMVLGERLSRKARLLVKRLLHTGQGCHLPC